MEYFLPSSSTLVAYSPSIPPRSVNLFLELPILLCPCSLLSLQFNTVSLHIRVVLSFYWLHLSWIRSILLYAALRTRVWSSFVWNHFWFPNILLRTCICIFFLLLAFVVAGDVSTALQCIRIILFVVLCKYLFLQIVWFKHQISTFKIRLITALGKFLSLFSLPQCSRQ